MTTTNNAFKLSYSLLILLYLLETFPGEQNDANTPMARAECCENACAFAVSSAPEIDSSSTSRGCAANECFCRALETFRVTAVLWDSNDVVPWVAVWLDEVFLFLVVSYPAEEDETAFAHTKITHIS